MSTALTHSTFFREYQGYSKGYTLNGFICYYYRGRRIAKKAVPVEIFKHLPTDRELVFAAIEERRIRNKRPYTGFSFLKSHGRKIYMFNGERIPKRIIKETEFEGMYDRARKWQEEFHKYRQKQEQKWKEEFWHQSQNTQSKKPENKTKNSSSESGNTKSKSSATTFDYRNLSPYQLLKQYKIERKRDWRQWMLHNHPDKNPDTDEELVKLINMAANIFFDS